MKKIFIFLSGVLVGGLSVYWFIGYHNVDASRNSGFANYIKEDAVLKYKNATVAASDWIESFAHLKKSKDIIYGALVANIQRALVVYYESEGEFPKSLDEVIKQSALPQDIHLKYATTPKGYILRLLDSKTGSVIKEILGSAEGL